MVNARTRPHDDGRRITQLHVNTTHPQDYVLVNERDGTRWRGTIDGRWVRDDVPVNPACGVHGPIPCEGAGCTCKRPVDASVGRAR